METKKKKDERFELRINGELKSHAQMHAKMLGYNLSQWVYELIEKNLIEKNLIERRVEA